MRDKVTSDHLSRTAYVYIRQSTLVQLQRNQESRRVQEKLMERAKEFGWHAPKMIDEDLGSSASGAVERAGFERLLAEVCAGSVGAIFAFEASRLARNGREWHTLLEMCAIVDTLLIDTEAIYDPKLVNDRLLLGLKGTFSELELGLFRARSHAAMREMAKRGELYGLVAVGYRKTRKGKLEKEPDLRVQKAIEFVFEKFPEFGSVRQLVRWLREEGVKIPRKEKNLDVAAITWALPTQGSLSSMLKNPVYAGAYSFGKSKTRTVLEKGRKRTVIKSCSDPEEWDILIKDNHPGYISWEDYRRNVKMIRQNINMKGSMAPGGIRGGASIFAGILRCGQCGRKVLVNYSGSHSRSIRYSCSTNCRNDDGKRCMSLSANKLEEFLTEQLLETVSPFGVEAALKTIELLNNEGQALRGQKELALEQAWYESERAWQQYNAADPLNRLVAGELERRWNDALEALHSIEDELNSITQEEPLCAEEREELLALGEELDRVWNNSETSSELKKRITRLLVKEVVLFEEPPHVRAVVHWQGGEHTEIKVKRLTYRDSSSPTDTNTIEIIRALARQTSDQFIPCILNRLKIRTAKGLTWNEARVRAIRCGYNIPVYKEGEREERGELNVKEAAEKLNVSRDVIARLIKNGLLPASQVCKDAPWVIKQEDLQNPQVRNALHKRRFHAPCEVSKDQLSLEFQ